MKLLPVACNLWFGRTENFNLRDTLDMPDEFVFVLLSIHSWSRAAAKGLDLGDKHRWSLAGQESFDFRTQQSFVAQGAHALHAGCFGNPGNVGSGRGLTAGAAAA